MPGYGLPDGSDGLRDWSWAEAVLREGHNYWLATSATNGAPHVMPIWAVWWDGALWFSTGSGSRKARNLRARGACSLGTERGTSAVVLEGPAEELAVSAVPEPVAQAYAAKYDGGYPSDSPVFRVAPRVAFGFSEAGDEFGRTATRWLFETA